MRKSSPQQEAIPLEHEVDHPNLEPLTQQPDLNETKVESEKRKNSEKIII